MQAISAPTTPNWVRRDERVAAGGFSRPELAEHSALAPKRAEQKPAARRTGRDDADPWQDQPPGELPPPREPVDEDSPGTIDRRQQNAMHAKFDKLGMGGKTDADPGAAAGVDAAGAGPGCAGVVVGVVAAAG
jgi:hypothetical protein